jgi:hypothetical protein
MRPITLAATLTLALTLPLAAQTTPTPAATDATTSDHYVPRSQAPSATPEPTMSGVSTPPPAQTVPAVAPAAPAIPAPKVALVSPPYSMNPILQLQGNARALLIFAPDPSNPALRQQMQLLHGHDLQLSQLNTVFVPLVTLAHPNDVIYGENLKPGNYRDQLSARRKFGIKYNQFALILLDKDGVEKFRSATPMTIADLTNAIEPHPGKGGE